MSFYKWLYTHLTPWWKRPWTFVIRDIYHEAEWLIQMIWLSLGLALIAVFVPWLITLNTWQIALVIIGVYTFGYVNGHCFWGKRWIKGEKS